MCCRWYIWLRGFDRQIRQSYVARGPDMRKCDDQGNSSGTVNQEVDGRNKETDILH